MWRWLRDWSTHSPHKYIQTGNKTRVSHTSMHTAHRVLISLQCGDQSWATWISWCLAGRLVLAHRAWAISTCKRLTSRLVPRIADQAPATSICRWSASHLVHTTADHQSWATWIRRRLTSWLVSAWRDDWLIVGCVYSEASLKTKQK